MTITAAQIAQLVNGTVEGDPHVTVSRGASIDTAQAGDVTFLDNPRYEPFAYTTQASILLVNNDFYPSGPLSVTLIRTEDVRTALAILIQKIAEGSNPLDPAISEKAHVHPDAKIGSNTEIGVFAVVEEGAVIGENTKIYPHVFVGRKARIGNNCVLFPGVRIHFDCEIGDNCILHANAVIGADGFGFAPQEDRSWVKVPQVGKVIIEDNVEIGACTCIDRATLGRTIIRSGTKLDNLVHIAHNVEVGHNTALAAQVGVAGSTRLGDNLLVGGQVGFAGHITVADGTQIQAQSGLAVSVSTPNTAIFGSPAIGYRDFIRSHIVFKQLPELQRKVLELEKKLKEMELKKNGQLQVP